MVPLGLDRCLIHGNIKGMDTKPFYQWTAEDFQFRDAALHVADDTQTSPATIAFRSTLADLNGRDGCMDGLMRDARLRANMPAVNARAARSIVALRAEVGLPLIPADMIADRLIAQATPIYNPDFRTGPGLGEWARLIANEIANLQIIRRSLGK